ncbi:MAG: N-acetylmuramoyl-L-alanine amidase [Patescibacteria group bacterium]
MKTNTNNKTRKVWVLQFFGTVALIGLAIVFLSGGARAEGQPGVQHNEIIDEPLQAVGQYISPEFTTDFPFGLVGVAWQGTAPDGLSVRYRQGGSWSQWFSPESMDAVSKDDWQYSIEPIIAGRADAVQYQFVNQGLMNRIKLIYVDTSRQESLSIFGFLKKLVSPASAQLASPIVTRAQWQADESWRLTPSGTESWPAEYVWPKKFVIHHTAGSDGGADPAATIRGIYYWHAVVLGWGDIGYNYLIDQNGTVYEGRAGGDGVVGAHVYRDATCAKQRFGGAQYEANFNRGTVGIALLGDYDTTTNLTDSVRTALTGLIAQKGLDLEIPPAGSGFLVDAHYPNIVGHRDLDCTNCPGTNLYTLVPQVRTEAQAKYDVLASAVMPAVYKATYVGQSEDPVAVHAGTEKQVWVDFRNDGNTVWRNYTAAPVQLSLSSPSPMFRIASGQPDGVVATLATPNVAPGEVGRFSFTIQGPTDELMETADFLLQVNGQALDGGKFSLTAMVTDLPYAASFASQQIAPAVFVRSRFTTTIKFTNMGTTAWDSGDVKLVIEDLGGKASRFQDTTWADGFGRIDFSEASVPPQGTATFSVKMTSPAVPGLFLNTFSLIGPQEIAQTSQYSITRVDSTYQAALVSQTIPPAVFALGRRQVTVTFKNTGIATWDRSVVLKTYDLGNAISRFRDTAWPSSTTAATMSQTRVGPGGTATFTFYLKTPAPGLYFSRYVLMRGADSVQGSEFSRLTRVDQR